MTDDGCAVLEAVELAAHRGTPTAEAGIVLGGHPRVADLVPVPERLPQAVDQLVVPVVVRAGAPALDEQHLAQSRCGSIHYRFTPNSMKVAQRDCRTRRFSRSIDFGKASNRRLPPPRMTGATMIASSSTIPASSPWRMTSPPPPMVTSLSPAVALARSIASWKPPTKVNSPESGSSSGRWVTTKTGTPKGFFSPQCSAASYMLRPTTVAPTLAVTSSRYAASSPSGSPRAPLS